MSEITPNETEGWRLSDAKAVFVVVFLFVAAFLTSLGWPGLFAAPLAAVFMLAIWNRFDAPRSGNRLLAGTSTCPECESLQTDKRRWAQRKRHQVPKLVAPQPRSVQPALAASFNTSATPRASIILSSIEQ